MRGRPPHVAPGHAMPLSSHADPRLDTSDKPMMTGATPGAMKFTPWKVWAWGGTCFMCNNGSKQGAQPSASPLAPALLIADALFFLLRASCLSVPGSSIHASQDSAVNSELL